MKLMSSCTRTARVKKKGALTDPVVSLLVKSGPACDGEKTCAACVDRRNSGKCSKLEYIRKQYVM